MLRLKEMIQLLDLYRQAGTRRIGIYALGEKGRLEIQELDLFKGGILRYRRMRELNERGEGIYFAPKGISGMLFLDDPEIDPDLEPLPKGTVVVVTSPGKFQLHIPVDKSLSRAERTKYQRLLCKRYKADKGAIDGDHLRRIPGFRNQKYPEKPMIRIFKVVEEGEELTVQELEAEIAKEPPRGAVFKHTPPRGGSQLSDDELLERAMRSNKKFRKLWEGEWERDYPSQSEADLALCAMLAYWTGGDWERVDRLFRRSGLYREKWDEVHSADGRTYGELTIHKAIRFIRRKKLAKARET